MPSTIMWHMRTDLPARIGVRLGVRVRSPNPNPVPIPHPYPTHNARIGFAHHWAETQAHHCAVTGANRGPLVHCAAEHVTSCTGAHWRHCRTRKEAFAEANCSLELVELKREARAWELARAKAGGLAAVTDVVLRPGPAAADAAALRRGYRRRTP